MLLVNESRLPTKYLSIDEIMMQDEMEKYEVVERIDNYDDEYLRSKLPYLYATVSAE